MLEEKQDGADFAPPPPPRKIGLNVKKKTLYVCFVDFKNAFHTVLHNILWNKLITCAIECKFLNLIKSLYSKVKSCVRSNSGLTDLFVYKRGLRQGCLLSALLFALF